MTIRTRKIIFYTLFGLFFIIGATVVLYAQGWRFDISHFATVKVGAIFVRSYPDDAAIVLDGKPFRNQSGFLSHGTVISDLFPKNYDLKLTKTGYAPWRETAHVSPSIVTEMKYAVLVPMNATTVFENHTNPASGFIADGDNLVIQQRNGTISSRNTPIENGTIVSSSSGFKNAVIRSGSTYTLYDFTERSLLNLNVLLARAGADTSRLTSVTIDPYDDGTAFAAVGTRLWSINLASAAATLTATTSNFAVSPSAIALAYPMNATGTSRIALYDKFSHTTTDTITIRGAIAGLRFVKDNTLGILGTNGSLYRYDIGSGDPMKLADDVKDFYPSKDGTMLATVEHRSIEIFSFSTDDYYRFNLPQVDAVKELVWYKDDSHLFVIYPDHISFLDLEDAGLHNFTTVSAGTAPFYNDRINALYIIGTGGALLRFDFPQ